MLTKYQISDYYSNARELVKHNKPKEAREYLLAILNSAYEQYRSASTILEKAKLHRFLSKWIAVSRDLYDKGITDNVLLCFGIPSKQEQRLHEPAKKSAVPEFAKIRAGENAAEVAPDSGVDFSGLFDDVVHQGDRCASLFEKNRSSVAEIAVTHLGVITSGTGFIISRNGYLLTNFHVVYNEDDKCFFTNVKMSFAGSDKGYKLKVLCGDKKADIALCSFDPEEAGEFGVIKRIDDYSKVRQGDYCVVIGNTFGKGISPFSGTIRFTKDESGNMVYTAPSNPGDSGGPVLNSAGECIGINKSKTISVNGSAVDAFANATPMDEIEAFLKKWCDGNGINL